MYKQLQQLPMKELRIPHRSESFSSQKSNFLSLKTEFFSYFPLQKLFSFLQKCHLFIDMKGESMRIKT